MDRKHFNREDRKRIIVTAFVAEIAAGKPNAMTVYDVCRKMGNRQSTHFQEIMLEMVAEEVLRYVTYQRSDGVWRRVFSLREDHKSYPKKEVRSLKVNGQLEIW